MATPSNMLPDIHSLALFVPAAELRSLTKAAEASHIGLAAASRRIAIARALMARPKLLLPDEPSLGLAPLVVKEIFSVIRRLKDQGVTILLVEQMASQALKIADRAHVLETGRITLEGSGAQLRRDPKVRAAYLGAH